MILLLDEWVFDDPESGLLLWSGCIFPKQRAFISTLEQSVYCCHSCGATFAYPDVHEPFGVYGVAYELLKLSHVVLLFDTD